MPVPIIKSSFAGGEITPDLWGHVDYTKVLIGLATARNGFIAYWGGFYSRAGTAFVGFSKQTGRSVPPRMVPFQFSINQGLQLEFGNFYVRVVSDGAYVVEGATAISNVTQSNPAIVSDVGHGYANGDWVYLSDVDGMTELNGQTYVVQGVTANTYQLFDVFGDPIDSTAFSAYIGGGTAARIYTLVTPYSENDLAWLKWTQSADVMSICCWNQMTGVNYPPQELSRISDDNWTMLPLSIAPPIGPPSTNTAYATVGGGTTDYQTVVTAIDSVTGSESVASPIADVPNSVDIATTAGSIVNNWAPVGNAAYYNIYGAPPAYNSTVPAGSLFGYLGTSYGNSFVNSNITPDFDQVPPLYLNPFAPGQVLGVKVTSGGSGLTTVTWAETTARGAGFEGFPVIVGGSMVAFVVVNGGENYQPGDSIAFNGAGFATGAVTFSANPTAGDTVTLNGDTWEFVAAITAANQVLIGSDLAVTLTSLVTALSASTDAQLVVANYYTSATVLTVIYKTAGTGGDAYTLAASAATPSGATLTGGSGIAGTAPTAILEIGPETGTYPSVVSYYQQRRVYAGTPNNPDTYFFSQPGAFTNFDSRVPTIDSDAIVGTPWSVEVNGIQWFVQMPGGLVTLTGLAAWQLTGAGGSAFNPVAITPASQQAQPQAFNGCSPTVPPIKINFEINYVQAKGSKYRDLSYNFYANIYTGADLTFLSSHLVDGHTIREMAWCEEPYKIIWTARDDGIMLSLTYLKEQEVIGWARHDTNGQIWSVSSVTEPPVDALYLATQRYYPNGRTAYFVERMDNRQWDSVEDCWCVDCGLQLPMPAPDATLQASSPNGLGAIFAVLEFTGGANYSVGTTITINDPTGSGAVIQPVIGGGVVTGFNITNGGVDYTNPSFVFNDPAQTGKGASINLVELNNSATFTASAAVFNVGNVGWVIRMGDGIATITNFVSATEVTANITQPIVAIIPNSGSPPTVAPASAGNWTMSEPVTTVSGLDHLIGMTVTGLADGNVIPPTVVDATGSIELPQAATSVIVGLGFQAQFQTLYLEAGTPTVQGRRKKIGDVTIRVKASRGLKTGANQPDGSTQSPMQIAPAWTNLVTVTDLGQPPYGSSVVPLYTGDIRAQTGSGFAKPGQIAVQQDNPLPMQIVAVIAELLTGDTPSDSVQTKSR